MQTKIYSAEQEIERGRPWWLHFHFKCQSVLPFTLLLITESAYLFINAVLPLYGLWFHTALLSQIGNWILYPTHFIFPRQAVLPGEPMKASPPPAILLSWKELPLLLLAFIFVFLLYLLAIYRLPQHITRRFIIYSTLLLGATCVLIPAVTSSDIYSYISYARIEVIYHLNPLTTLPSLFRRDPVYPQLYWIDQPSAYGPIWAIITVPFQWVTLHIFGDKAIWPMVLALRIWGVIMHLCSTLLIWSIGGHLQRLSGNIQPSKRLQATLAFAWNPLLLLEACINAHNDATLLLLVLLAIWFLLPGTARSQLKNNPGPAKMLGAAVMLALATCLKINIVLLAPGLLFYFWKQPGRQIKHIATAIIIYVSLIILLYAPFWQHGAILNVFRINPATYRDINTLPEFSSHLYNGIKGALGYPLAPAIGSLAEKWTHSLSMILFALIYLLLCWKALRHKQRIQTLPGLIRWLALVWLLYCAIGAPWFWPWYMVTFFGLYALIDTTTRHTSTGKAWILHSFHIQTLLPFAVYLLTFSLLTMNCFYVWAPGATSIPGLPEFRWAYLRGLWIWGLPLLAMRFHFKSPFVKSSQFTKNKRGITGDKPPMTPLARE